MKLSSWWVGAACTPLPVSADLFDANESTWEFVAVVRVGWGKN